MTTHAQVCENGHIMNTSPNPEYIKDGEYCTECGTKGHIECPECDNQKIIVSEENVTQEDVSRTDLPLFCRSCGTNFPWAGENGMIVQAGTFVDDDYANGAFDEQTIGEINRCYRIGANTAVLVLYRKLIENTVIEILRGHYGTSQLEKFYNEDEGQFHGFSDLIDTLDNDKSDLRQYCNNLDNGIIAKIWSFKHEGDAMAHSIKYDIDDEELADLSDRATYVANVLLETRNEIQRAN
ncbi:DUF2321 domain-containing protein [Haloarchaeobius sp. DFWS5]|uniref:DUF2321 domain-containing protein n=1 Tax=Haloarchaeobius sp. DFWS5 TaxID=3446114 RepID=UPI003EB803FD